MSTKRPNDRNWSLLEVAVAVAICFFALASPCQATQRFKLPTASGEVEKFLKMLHADEFSGLAVGDFRIVDLDGDGQEELVSTIDFSSRQFFNRLVVVSRRADTFRWQVLDTWNLESLQDAIQDLDGDGRQELILPQPLTPYVGGSLVATWRCVFSRAGDGDYETDKGKVITFLRDTELGRIRLAISQTKSRANDLEGEYFFNRLAALEVERFKLESLDGEISPGELDFALALAKDRAVAQRALAIGILREIDDLQSTRALRHLTSDSNPAIADEALDILRKRRTYMP
jgi:hypothetical protein